MKSEALFVAPLAIVIACGGGPTHPEDELTVRQESDHGVYFMTPGDSVDVASQEVYYVWLLDQLGVALPEQLQYFKYLDRGQLKKLTGEDTNGFAEFGNFRFHTIWPIDNHECVHALVSSVLNPAPPLFNEGIAVAHQTLPHLDVLEPVWSGEPLDAIALQVKQAGDMPPLEDLLANSDFFDHETDFIYPIAGSFVYYLIRQHGYAPLKKLFVNSSFQQPPAELLDTFLQAYGIELAEAWADWLESLGP